MKRSSSIRHPSFRVGHCPRAFTLLELLVVCAVLGLLALKLCSALARSNNTQALQCMNNHRQLCAAWRMHADDNNGRFVYSSDNGLGTPPYVASQAGPTQVSNNNAWTWSKLDFNANNSYNWDPAADITLRPLWPYTAKDTNLFKCPSDRSSVSINGQNKPRVRSVSMNFFLGGFAGDPNSASQLHAGTTNTHFQLYLKVAEISVPGKIFVFLDERADLINWGSFVTDMTGYTNTPGAYAFNLDLPGFYHDQSCTFSFADGHVEEKRWLSTATMPPPVAGFLNGGKGAGTTFPVPYDPDVAWLQDHATRPK